MCPRVATPNLCTLTDRHARSRAFTAPHHRPKLTLSGVVPHHSIGSDKIYRRSLMTYLSLSPHRCSVLRRSFRAFLCLSVYLSRQDVSLRQGEWVASGVFNQHAERPPRETSTTARRPARRDQRCPCPWRRPAASPQRPATAGAPVIAAPRPMARAMRARGSTQREAGLRPAARAACPAACAASTANLYRTPTASRIARGIARASRRSLRRRRAPGTRHGECAMAQAT